MVYIFFVTWYQLCLFEYVNFTEYFLLVGVSALNMSNSASVWLTVLQVNPTPIASLKKQRKTKMARMSAYMHMY